MRCVMLIAALVWGSSAHADGTSAPAASAPAASAPSAPAAATGFAVLAQGSALSAAWPLAKALYARNALRPSQVDEAHARVLAGEPPPNGAPSDLRDLAETRAAIHGDDAPSRQLLAAIATNLRLRGIVMVEMLPAPNDPPQGLAATIRARVFLADSGFDAAQYAPDAVFVGEPTWDGAVRSIERAFGKPLDPSVAAPSAAGRMTGAMTGASKAPIGPVKEGDSKRPFYLSPWFWGAIGAAVLVGGGVYLATRDNTASTIHLQLQVPK